MVRSLFPFIIGSFCACALFISGVAHAGDGLNRAILIEAPKPLGDVRALQREPESETFIPVAKRSEDELAAQPIRWHGFQISPEIMSSQTIDSNILVSDTNEEADTITTIQPSVLINKKWRRHDANLRLGAEGKKYWSNQENDVFNYNVKLDGTLEARRELKIPFEVSYSSDHEERSQNFSGTTSKEPIAFNSYGAALGIIYAPNRLKLSLIGRHSAIAFDNGTDINNRRLVREDDDRTSDNIELRGSYALIPNHTPFISVNLQKIQYDKGSFTGSGFNGPKRNSENLSILGGWQFQYKGILYADLGIGISQRDYDSNQLSDIDTLNMAGNLNWNVTKRGTFNLGVVRTITDNNDSLQGVVLTDIRTGYDQEILHNLFLSSFINYATLDVENSDRLDRIYGFGTGIEYQLSPRFTLSTNYEFNKRSSNAPGLDYDQHKITARLNSKF